MTFRAFLLLLVVPGAISSVVFSDLTLKITHSDPKKGPILVSKTSSSVDEVDLIFLNLKEGEDLDLTCQIVAQNGKKSFNEKYQLNWFLSSSLENRVSSIQGSNSHRIKVKSLEASDSGPIHCQATQDWPYHSELVEDNEPGPMLTAKVILKVKSKSAGTCGSNFYQCSISLHCIAHRYACDGIPDCPDGEDESVEDCGFDPCHAKLRCEDHRCMDPGLCCDAEIHPNCTVTPKCCLPLLERNRHFYQLGRENSKEVELKYLHTTAFIIVGCILAVVVLIILITYLMCRLLMRRSNSNGRRCRTFILQDLDLMQSFLNNSSQPQGGQPHQNGFHLGITYNINNGVQIVNQPAAPPPYGADPDPPPPYGIDDQEMEQNNNGDINGNGDFANQNIQPNPVNDGQHNQENEQAELLEQPDNDINVYNNN